MQLEQFKIYDVNETVTIENYPYGFRDKCTLYATIEETARGQRLKTQTLYKGHMNKPKYGTYGTGRFLATKEGFLYDCYYIVDERVLNDETGKYEPQTRITIYKFKGNSQPVATFEPTPENKNLIPKDILKRVQVKTAINNAISNAWNEAEQRQIKLFEGKTDAEIKTQILNIDNWKRGGEGYYIKDGFGRTYYKNIIVSFKCPFFSESFILSNESQKVKLTAKGRKWAENEGFKLLKAWLSELTPEYITITPRADTFPTVSIGNKTMI